MRGEPRQWPAPVALLALGMLLLVGLAACSSDQAKATNIPVPTNGDITLQLDRAAYTPSLPVGVTVKNTSKKTYYALDGRSACTFLQLEEYMQAKKAWAVVNLCTLGAPPIARLIIPSASVPFTFAPGNAPADANRWQDGLYRVSLTYTTKADGTGTTSTAYSAGFLISG